jgi:hypothetical protein
MAHWLETKGGLMGGMVRTKFVAIGSIMVCWHEVRV